MAKLKKKLTPDEDEAFELVKKMIQKPRVLKGKDFEPGQIIIYTYRAKYDQNPYDKAPMAMILSRTRKHTLGLNWNWIPPRVRKGMLASIMRVNKKNVEKGLPLNFTYKGIKKVLMRSGAPALRKYINNRISRKGVVIPHTAYNKVVHLRGEHFTGISAEEAWRLAIVKMKARKGKIR